RRDLATKPHHVAALAAVDEPQPALERHLLARLVELAIVDHVPCEGLAAALLHPAAVLVPPAAIVGDERDVVTALGDEVVRALDRARAEAERREALLVTLALDAERPDL